MKKEHEPVRVEFSDTTPPSIPNWQTDYADKYGDNPTLAVYLEREQDAFVGDVSASPLLQYDNTKKVLQSVSYDYGAPLF